MALAGLTTRGRSLLAAGVALLVCSLLLGQRDLLRASLFLVVLPLAAVLLVSRTRYRLACTRVLDPPRVEAGRPSTVRLRLDNVSRLPSGVLLMEDALPYVLGGRPRFVLDRIEPQGVREVSYPVRAEVRGRYRVGPLSVRLTDPFGLVELNRSFSNADDLVVTPVVEQLPSVRLGGDWAAGGDSIARSVAVSGSDDAATREYRYGDDLRKVHWRSTARTGELMVRREEQPFQSRATLLLDARHHAHRGDGPGSSFEWAVSAVASIGVSLARSGFVLSLLTDSGLDLLAPGVPTTEGVLLDTLSSAEPSSGSDLEQVSTRMRRAGVDGVLVAVLGHLDTDDADRLARLRHGATSCVAVLLDTSGWAPAGSRGRRTQVATSERAHDDVAHRLAAAGWRVLRVAHGTTLASVWPEAAGRAGTGGTLPSHLVPAPRPTTPATGPTS